MEAARAGFQNILLNPKSSPQRTRAALDGLVAMGGPSTNEFFQQSILGPEVPYVIKALLVKGQQRPIPLLPEATGSNS